MNWTAPKLWEGEEVWILGGGPSLTKQFNIPDELVQKVIQGLAKPSDYSPYMEKLHNKHVIGINVSYLIGDWIDLIFFGDGGFFLAHMNGLAAFPGLKCSCHPQVVGYNWVKYLAKDTKRIRGISPNPKMVSWNGNSGAAAISVAANMGAKRIVLVGFDMKLNETNNQHWHNLYGRLNAPRNPRKPFQLPFNRHLQGFPQIDKDAKSRGIEIINASPDSAIKEFPKFNVKDLL